MAIKLASLFIEIAADAGKLSAELKKSNKDTKAWASKVKKSAEVATVALKTVAVGTSLVTAGLAAMYISNASTLDSLGKTAAKLGDTTEALKVFGVAAGYAGVGVEASYTSLQRMTRQLAEAANGTGAAKDAITELGLDAQRLAELSPSQAFYEITEAMETIPKASDRVRLAMKILGKEGVSLLNVTSGVLKQAQSDVDALGGALTSIEVSQIEAANDSIARVGIASDLVTDRLTAKMAPAIMSVADALFEGAKQSSQLDSIMDTLILSTLNGMSTVASSTGSLIRFIDGRPEISALGALGYMMFGKKGIALGAAVGLSAGLIKDTFDSVKERVASGTSDSVAFIESEIDRLESKLALRTAPGLSLIFDDEGDENVRDKIKGLEWQLSIKKQLAEIDGTGERQYTSALDETQSLSTAAADGLEYLSASLEYAIDNYGKLEGAANAANDSLIAPELADKVTAASAPDEIADAETPNVESRDFSDGLDDVASILQAELDLKTAYREQYFSEQLQAEQRFQSTWTLFQESGSKNRLQILYAENSGALESLSQHSRGMFEINKAVGLGNAGIYIAEGIAAAWKLGWPLGAPAAATVAINGAAQIKAITSATYGKASIAASSASTPVADVSSSNSAIAANDSGVSNGDTTSAGGLTIMGFHTPGASDEQKINEQAMWLQEAQENDLLVPDSDGGLTYNGTGADAYTPYQYSQTA